MLVMDRLDRKEVISKMHKDNVIAAAEELFIEKGYDKTTMDDISAKAQYSKRTVYIHFQSKEEIYSYVILKGFELLKKRLKEALDSSTDFMQQFQGLCQALMNFHNNSPEYFRGVSVCHSKQFDLENCLDIEKEVFQANEEIYHILETFLRDAQDNGIVIKNIDLKKAVFIIWGGMLQIIILSDKKNDYIQNNLKSSQSEITTFGFILLLNAILDPDGE